MYQRAKRTSKSIQQRKENPFFPLQQQKEQAQQTTTINDLPVTTAPSNKKQ